MLPLQLVSQCVHICYLHRGEYFLILYLKKLRSRKVKGLAQRLQLLSNTTRTTYKACRPTSEATLTD